MTSFFINHKNDDNSIGGGGATKNGQIYTFYWKHGPGKHILCKLRHRWFVQSSPILILDGLTVYLILKKFVP